MRHKPDQFYFHNRDIVGYAAAEDDKEFLSNCFIDTGDLDILRNTADKRFLIVGRTGAGKSALLQELVKQERVIELFPERLALSYVSNSNILKFVQGLDVNLGPFYKLLWRHVIAVELLKAYFDHRKEENTAQWWVNILDKLKGKKNKEAIEYLKEWGESFWQETDYRIKETTTKLEQDLKAKIGTGQGGAIAGAEAAAKLTNEQKAEVQERAQSVVSKVQIQKLEHVIDTINEILGDAHRPYYIVIDRLDADWVEDKFRLHLIRGLIDTSREFNNKVENLKIIIATRVDLLDEVFFRTRQTGSQSDKYESLYLNLQWSKERMLEMIDKRLTSIVQKRHPAQHLSHRNVLPKTVDDQQSIDWILKRTLMRPRDLIDFFNKCLELAENKPNVTADMLKKAEVDYSRARLKALHEEWHSQLPNLDRFIDFLKLMPQSFAFTHISLDAFGDFCLSEAADGFDLADTLSMGATDVANALVEPREFLVKLLLVFYRTGIVSLKLESYTEYADSYHGKGGGLISPHDISDRTRIQIHPALFRALGINSKKSA